MEAIIQESGRQYKVQEGGTIEIDYREVEPGSPIEFGNVLYVGGAGEEGSARIGSPTVEGARVVGTVLGTVQGPKLVVTQFRRRKNSRSRVGHRCSQPSWPLSLPGAHRPSAGEDRQHSGLTPHDGSSSALAKVD